MFYMATQPPDITFTQIARDANRERINTQEGQILAHVLAEQQRTNELLQGLPQALLTVTKPGPDGKPEVLVSKPVEAGKRVPSEARGIDAAGIPFRLYEAVQGRPWGIALVLSRNAQSAMFERWAKQFVLQGLEVRQYAMDEASVIRHGDAARNAPLPEEVTAYTRFRHRKVTEEEVLQQARATYDVTQKILAACQPKPCAVFFWGHSEHWSRAPALACRDAGIQTLHVEGAMFPRLSWLEHGTGLDSNHLVINRNGQYYENCSDIDTLWAAVKDTPLTALEASRIDSYIEAWKAVKASKYGQTPDPTSPDADERRLLFVPLQIDVDASMYYANALVKTGVDLLDLIAETASPRHWRIIAKRHPHDSWDENAEARYNSMNAKYGHLRVLRDGNIHDLIGMADCVCGINSTVLMEACCYGKPVVALGSSCFTGKGFTLDVRDRDSLGQLFRYDRNPLRFTPDMHEAFRRFLHMMMWSGNAGQGFFVDIDLVDAAKLVGG